MPAKKIPRAIEIELTEQLKKIDPDINLAIKKLLLANSGAKQALPLKLDSDQELAIKIWPHIKGKIKAMIILEIEDARRGY